MTKEFVKKYIQSKFGTMSRFCRLSKYNRYELQKVLQSKDAAMELRKIYELGRLTDATTGRGEITQELRESLVGAIIARYGTIPEFCEKKGFSLTTIYQILDGRRKKITPKVKEIMKVLKVKA